MNLLRKLAVCFLTTLAVGCLIVAILYGITCGERFGGGIQGFLYMFAIMYLASAWFAAMPTLLYSLIAATFIVREETTPLSAITEYLLAVLLIIIIFGMIVVFFTPDSLMDSLPILPFALVPGLSGIYALRKSRDSRN